MQAQSEDFQRIDSSDFLDKARFRDAIKGKAGLKGVEKGIHTLLERIEKEIQHKALEVQRNAATLATLSADQQLLFQDRGTLLDFTESKLAEVIEDRLAKLVAEHEVSAAGPSQSPERVVEPSSTATAEAPELFRITLELQCSKSSAVEIARSIREGFGHREGVGEIRLSRGN